MDATHNIGRSPEQHGSTSARSKVTVEEWQIGNGLLRANVTRRGSAWS